MRNEKSERFCACIYGDLPVVSRMLEDDSNFANSFGMVRPDHREFMKQQNADDGWTAPHLAAHYGQADLVQL
ncbi:MAG: ankyrin repeat domain-containing protein [Candidatus Obscuribacterales bacterium]|nr:ankyrin repeat domain-containing protein [Candidatus Obscuribacterales bacterium]